MKGKLWRFILLVISIAAINSACSRRVNYEKPVKFFYLHVEDSKLLIGAETREGNDLEQDSLLQLYFQGPLDRQALKDFPEEIKASTFEWEGQTLCIQWEDSMGRRSGSEITALCGCICKTVFEITDAEAVRFTCRDSLLNGQKALVFQASDFVEAVIS